MLKTIITAVITYLATSIDEIPVLFMLYMDSAHRGKGKTITFSYYMGTFLLVAAGLFGAAGLNLLPVKWAIGLIGIIPVIMGIKILIKGDEDEEEAMEKSKKFTALWLKVLIITLSLGADDLGVYIPLFTSLNTMEILQMIIVFAIGTGILCLISYRLTTIGPLANFIEKRERFFTGAVFIAVGIMVMIKCGTFAGIMGLF